MVLPGGSGRGGTNIYNYTFGSNTVAAGANVTVTTNVTGSNIVYTVNASASGGGGSTTNIPVGQTLYLDATFGNDATASRTNQLAPFLTVSNAIAAMLSGDTLVVRGGTYLINPKADTVSVGVNRSGGLALTNKNNIRIVGEPGSMWKMSGQWLNGGGTARSCPMFNITACTNVMIEGLTMVGIRTNAPVSQDYAVMLNQCEEIVFRDCSISNWQNQGITDLSQTTANRNISVLDCTFSDCGGTNHVSLGGDGTAFSCIASNLIIRNCRFYRNFRDFEQCCNGDAREILYEGNISEACYGTSILIIGTNTSELKILNNLAIGYAANAGGLGAQWLEFWAASNAVVRGNQVLGYDIGIGYSPVAGLRLVDVGIYDNVFNDATSFPIFIHSSTATAASVGRISIMRNKFKNSSYQAVSISANNSRIEGNEFADCNANGNAGGVIRIGYSSGVYTNSTNMTIVGNRIYTSEYAANAATGIVVYALSSSNVVWGNEVKNYAGVVHDLGSGTRNMPINSITPGSMLYSDTNSRMAKVTIGSGVAFDGSTGTLTGTGGGGTPGGANRSIQWNSNSVFAGNSQMQYDPLGFFSEFVGPTLSVNNGSSTNFMDPFGFGALGTGGTFIYTSNGFPRWQFVADGSLVPYSTSNRYDVGSWAIPVRTNYANQFSAKAGVDVGVGSGTNGRATFYDMSGTKFSQLEAHGAIISTNTHRLWQDTNAGVVTEKIFGDGINQLTNVGGASGQVLTWTNGAPAFMTPSYGGSAETNVISAGHVYGLGTNWNLRNSAQAVTFGGTNLSVSLAAGTYIMSFAILYTPDISGGLDTIKSYIYNVTDSTQVSVGFLIGGITAGGYADLTGSDVVVLTGTKTISVYAVNLTSARGLVDGSYQGSVLTYVRLY